MFVNSPPFDSPVSRWSLHARHSHNKGVPGRRGDLCTKPPGHVQPHLPGGEEASGGTDQRRLQIHIGGGGPGHGRRRQLPGALLGHRYEWFQTAEHALTHTHEFGTFVTCFNFTGTVIQGEEKINRFFFRLMVVPILLVRTLLMILQLILFYFMILSNCFRQL